MVMKISLVFLWDLFFKFMKKLLLLLILFCITQLNAKVLISPIEAMQENYGVDTVVSKKNILLNNTQFQTIQKNAHVKLNTKIYRIFTAKGDDDRVIGYGILINKKVRSKNAVVLYFIKNNTLQGIEIIAFNEPKEYTPSKSWSEQFIDTKTTTMLQLNRDIPSISGATLSARAVTDGSRVAFALYNKLLEGK